METIATVKRLRDLLGEPGPLTQYKVHRELSEQGQAFVRQSPFFLLATASTNGVPTVSPKGGEPGFVRVKDAMTLLIHERPGNRLLYSLENILSNPKVGLIFLSPGTDETLRIGGHATLLHDDAINARFAARGKPALLLMRVRIEECYFHCAKAFLRSALWNPSSWPGSMNISFSAEINLRRALEASAMLDLDSQIAKRYETDL